MLLQSEGSLLQSTENIYYMFIHIFCITARLAFKCSGIQNKDITGFQRTQNKATKCTQYVWVATLPVQKTKDCTRQGEAMMRIKGIWRPAEHNFWRFKSLKCKDGFD